MKKLDKRGSGILLHISSLPSNYGIGTFGEEAYRFADFLKESGQSYWQILPLGQTSFGDSPYQSFSINAGNPYFIDLDLLAKDGLLKKEDYISLNWGDNSTQVDYGLLYNTRYEVLKKAFENFNLNDINYKEFLKKERDWLDDYAIFMTMKRRNSNSSWDTWDIEFKTRDKKTLANFIKENSADIDFWRFIQYKFYEQWNNLKDYVNNLGIDIIGDVPIYVAYDSVDVWKNPEFFQLDENLEMVSVAGCPPDGFSADGQLWGNPLYNWEYMEKTKYKWWINRLESAISLYNIVRMDHFRGFESYYSIPAKDKTAVNGHWEKGPGMKLFNAVKKNLGDLDIIAEDLGFVTDEVAELLKDSGFPGMKLLEFAFDSREGGDYLPHNYTQNSVGYIGTHDNDTAVGWLVNSKTEDIEYMRMYLDIYTFDDKATAWKMIDRIMSSVCNTVIIQMQDYLGLGSESRMNTPSALGSNWSWRMKKEDINLELAKGIIHVTGLYKRMEI